MVQWGQRAEVANKRRGCRRVEGVVAGAWGHAPYMLLERLEEGFDVLEFLRLEENSHGWHGGCAQVFVTFGQHLVWFQEALDNVGGRGVWRCRRGAARRRWQRDLEARKLRTLSVAAATSPRFDELTR